MSDQPAPIRTTRTAYAKADHEAAFLVYASLDEPSVAETAAIMGISERTLEYWCRHERWVERRAEKRLDRVATASHIVDTLLLRQAQNLADRLLSLAFQDADIAVSLRATTHALALLGKSPVTKTASVVQHMRDGGRRPGEDTRTVEELAGELHARLGALGGGEGGGGVPGEINEREDDDDDERGPSVPSADASEFGDEERVESRIVFSERFGDQDVIDVEFSEGSS